MNQISFWLHTRHLENLLLKLPQEPFWLIRTFPMAQHLYCYNIVQLLLWLIGINTSTTLWRASCSCLVSGSFSAKDIKNTPELQTCHKYELCSSMMCSFWLERLLLGPAVCECIGEQAIQGGSSGMAQPHDLCLTLHSLEETIPVTSLLFTANN